jgi:hypothetical protein
MLLVSAPVVGLEGALAHGSTPGSYELTDEKRRHLDDHRLRGRQRTVRSTRWFAALGHAAPVETLDRTTVRCARRQGQTGSRRAAPHRAAAHQRRHERLRTSRAGITGWHAKRLWTAACRSESRLVSVAPYPQALMPWLAPPRRRHMTRFVMSLPGSHGATGSTSRRTCTTASSRAGGLYLLRAPLHKMWKTLWTRLSCENLSRGSGTPAAETGASRD